MDLNIYSKPRSRIFYGWWIVAVGVLTQIAGVFSLSSTLSIFLKPVTEDLGVSRGAFSLVRTGEIIVSAAMAPLVGPIVDRRGGRFDAERCDRAAQCIVPSDSVIGRV